MKFIYFLFEQKNWNEKIIFVIIANYLWFLLYYKFVDVRDVDGKNSIDIRVDIEWYFESIGCL